MYRILLLGKIGQLGWELQRTLPPLGEVIALDYPDVDFAHPEDLRELVAQTKPQVIFNAVAYTAVDRAESEPEKARNINAIAPGVLAENAKKTGAVLVHYSTDYVFDGEKGTTYIEDDMTHPLNTYGLTKLEGEQAVLSAGGPAVMLRTSWVYSTRRDSFVTKVLQWSRSQPVLRMVTDQVGSPTWARMLAEVSTQMLVKAGEDVYGWFGERRGIYHLGGNGSASRMDWAQEILKNDPCPEDQVNKEILGALTTEFPTPAQRPLFTALDCQKFKSVFGLSLPDWKVALKLAMETVV